jgi:hypothetical protein
VPSSEGVSIEVLAERLVGIRHAVTELDAEQKRMRTRLHNLEGFAAAYLDQQRANRRGEERQYRRLEVRVQVLTLAVGFAAVASPIIVAILTGK